jgi:transposase
VWWPRSSGDELCPRVGFIVTNRARPSERVVAFYNHRGTCEQYIKSIPRRWKVIQHAREKFTCRECEKVSQAPAPFYVLARGWAGPSLLAMILFKKFGQHQPLNRQAERYAREGVPLSLSTLADQVGGCCAVPAAADRRIVPVLAKGKTDTGR